MPLSLVGKALALVAAVSMALLIGPETPAQTSVPSQISMIVVPHPDDESSAWSMIEGASGNYKLFVYLTRGNASGFCTSGAPGYNSGTGERAPNPVPLGQHAPSCDQARINSTLNFLRGMRNHDATLPSGYTHVGTKGPYATYGFNICRYNGGSTCVNDTSVEVYDGGTNGKALFFNLGDGDLTQDEVTWAVQTVMANQVDLGIPALPYYNLIGSAWYNGRPGCHYNPHPDHLAVHRALYYVDQGTFAYQTAPTCYTDPRPLYTYAVTPTMWNTMFMVSGGWRWGVAQVEYGWLHASYWPHDAGTTQVEGFHRTQRFWRAH